MNVGIFLAIGESWKDLEQKGQASLFMENILHIYSNSFEKVFVFSYGVESKKLLPNVYLVGSKWSFHRYIYALILPIVHSKLIKQCNVIRGMQVTGGIPGLIAKIIFQKKIVINFGYDYTRMAQVEGRKMQASIFKLIVPLVTHLVDAVIVTTNSLKSLLRRKSHVFLIPNSVDTNRFKPKNSAKRIGILYVGRLEAQKNLSLLIKAVSLSRWRRSHIVLIGSGTQDQKLRSLAKKTNLQIKFIAKVENSKLPTYYSQSNIFALTSSIEGHPKALIEAMSCGCTVIGTKVPGILDVIMHRKNGWLVEPTLSSFVRGLNQLTDLGLRRKLGRQARSTVLAHYDAKINWKMEVELLKNLSN